MLGEIIGKPLLNEPEVEVLKHSIWIYLQPGAVVVQVSASGGGGTGQPYAGSGLGKDSSFNPWSR
jgi:hypothetical protein